MVRPLPASLRRPVPLLVLAATLSVAAPAVGAGFGPPRAVSPAGRLAVSPVAAVAPTGRTIVLWSQFDRRHRRIRTLAVDGPSPSRLGPARTVPAGARAAENGADRTLLAAPDGGIVACFGDEPKAVGRHPEVLGCAFAPPGRRFGPLRVVLRRPRTEHPTMQAAILPDGRVALVTTRRTHRGHGHEEIRAATLAPDGTFSDEQRLGSVRRDTSVSLATTDDGAVAVAWAVPVGSQPSFHSRPVLLLRAPGARRFVDPGPVVPVPTVVDHDFYAANGVQLVGGPALVVRYTPAGSKGPMQAVVRGRDGRFGPALTAPALAHGSLGAAGIDGVEDPIAVLADGTPLQAATVAEDESLLCRDFGAGAVGAGALAPEGARPAQRLSAPRQTAVDPRVAGLADGSAIVAWYDIGHDVRERVEVAIRPAGAATFSAPQVLPGLAAESGTLAAAGSDAVLVWNDGELPDGPSRIVVSALRPTPPYAPQAPRPAPHGSPDC